MRLFVLILIILSTYCYTPYRTQSEIKDDCKRLVIKLLIPVLIIEREDQNQQNTFQLLKQTLLAKYAQCDKEEE